MISSDVVTDSSVSIEQSIIQIQLDADINQVVSVYNPNILLEFPVGSPGSVGTKGPIGDKGPQGDKGLIGDTGPAASFESLISSGVSLDITTRAPNPDELPGPISIFCQSALGPDPQNGAGLFISTGSAFLEGNGGDINVFAGTGYIGGSMNLTGGEGSMYGGSVIFTAGFSTEPDSVGGGIVFSGGNSAGVNGVGGDITFTPGVGTSVYGKLNLQSGAGSALVITQNGTDSLIGFFGAIPVTQPKTTGLSSAVVTNSGTAVNINTTFDGWTLPKLVKALRELGLIQ